RGASARGVRSVNICVIGNSHAAAIKQAWTDAAPGWGDGTTLTFFAAKAQLLRDLALEDGALVARSDELAAMLRLTSGGSDEIALDAYDGFILIGLGLRFNIASLCDNVGTAAHLKWGPSAKLVSRACFAAMIEADLQDENMALAVLAWIRAVCDK